LEFLKVILVEKSSFKVPGGKLVRIALSRENHKICTIKITGDFFLHPESTLDKIEEKLVGAVLHEPELRKRIESVIAENRAILIGATPADIARAIMLAVT
jgi:lipoate-protein ligase A